jgi:ribosomal-protein-alanine N-acetyltransferase
MDADWSIRPARFDDLPSLVVAERECFSDPWSEAGLRETLQDETAVALVASWPPESEQLAGYLFARTIAGEGEILNLAVRPACRRQGLARALLWAGLAQLRERGARQIFLEVRESNHAARALYAGAGFRPAGSRPDYYRRPREDAIVLRRDIGVLA